jgi:predicted enzyme related to lactoylglutathione lyase
MTMGIRHAESDQEKSVMMNPITYFEVAGPDAKSLADFYAAVFGWEPTPGPFPNYYSLQAAGGAGLAGGFRQDDRPEHVFYVKVPDLAAALESVVRAGGRVLIPPTDVPGVVHFALFEDPAGNRTGIMQ